MSNIDPVIHLRTVDPILAVVIDRVERPQWNVYTDYFQALVESIISQQLSVKAGDTITKRFIQLFGDSTFPKAKDIIKMDTEKIRSAGISYAKIKYIKDLAEKIMSKAVKLDAINEMENEVIIEHLIQVKGIGRWTAEMFLMFALKREDVFSYGDLGLRNAMQKLYKMKKHPTLKQAEKISAKWRPYRTWACRYLWASLEFKD